MKNLPGRLDKTAHDWYNVTNDIFAENAWYFRNALVRANYTNVEKNIYETTKYLELFLNNLIYNENNELKNRYLHIKFEEKVDIEGKKVDIEGKKVDIHSLKLTSKTKKRATHDLAILRLGTNTKKTKTLI